MAFKLIKPRNDRLGSERMFAWAMQIFEQNQKISEETIIDN